MLSCRRAHGAAHLWGAAVLCIAVQAVSAGTKQRIRNYHGWCEQHSHWEANAPPRPTQSDVPLWSWIHNSIHPTAHTERGLSTQNTTLHTTADRSQAVHWKESEYLSLLTTEEDNFLCICIQGSSVAFSALPDFRLAALLADTH